MTSTRRRRKAEPKPEQSPLVTAKEAMTYLRLSKTTLYRRLEEGAIPGVKIGRAWRIRREDLERLAKSN